jgi:hypothetical protein
MPAQASSYGRRLTHSLDFDSTLEHVVRLPIPSLADWCLAYIPGDGDARLPRLAVAHADPSKEALLRAAWQSAPVELQREHPLLVSLRSRKSVLHSPPLAGDLAAARLRERDAELLKLVGLESLLAVPLVAHGLVVGALMMVWAGNPPRTFDSVALDSAADVANCCAQAIYNAQLFWEARLAERTHDELVNAGSQDLLRLAANLRRRVNRLHAHVASTPLTSPTVLHHGLSEIEDLAARMLLCIRGFAPIDIAGEGRDAVE